MPTRLAAVLDVLDVRGAATALEAARERGCCERTVERALAELRAAGYVAAAADEEREHGRVRWRTTAAGVAARYQVWP